MSEPIYTPADFGVLRDTKYGVGFHWTTWTAPKTGEPLSFEEAVNQFDVDRFVEQVVACGAGHVLFPLNHIIHHFPFPHPVADAIMPGRTCQRDLIMEIADGLAAQGILLMVYYNHGTHWDPDWTEAVDAKKEDTSQYFRNVIDIISWIGNHYGNKIIGFWFDIGWGDYPNFPWYDVTMAAKAGNPNRLVTHNSSVEVFRSSTPYQDFWSGEGVRLNFIPRGGELTPNGLPWYNFVDWHPDYFLEARCGEWGLSMKIRDLDWPAPCACSIKQFLDRFIAVKGAVTFNLFIWQDGEIYAHDLQVMSELKQLYRV